MAPHCAGHYKAARSSVSRIWRALYTVPGRSQWATKGAFEIAMQESKNEFKSSQAVLDAIQAAREVQEDAWEAWFAVRDVDSDEFESARRAYIDANLEVDRLVEIYNGFRRRR